MLYREIILGFLLAGFIGLLPASVFHGLFLQSAPDWIRVPENALVGPLIAVVSFVCSVGNVPLAAVLWADGLSFAGVMAFIFADLIVIPIVLIYRKYYGTGFALRITALMYGTMVLAALAIAALFSAASLIPETRPTRADVFMGIQVDYKLALNVLGIAIFAVLFGLTMRRGVKDPMCGMTVDRTKALSATVDGQTHYFCSEHCRAAYLAESPEPVAVHHH
jgi:YHS domain-containing protein